MSSGNTIMRWNEAGNYNAPLYGPTPIFKTPAILMGIKKLESAKDRPSTLYVEVLAVRESA